MDDDDDDDDNDDNDNTNDNDNSDGHQLLHRRQGYEYDSYA